MKHFALALALLLAACDPASKPADPPPPPPPPPPAMKKEEPKKEEPKKEEPKADVSKTEPKGNPLLDPKHPDANKQAPAKFLAKFETSKGEFVIEVQRDWSPKGADRFYNLVKNGYFTDVRFFRVVTGFVAQFGIHGDPKVSAAWRETNIPDDPVKESNKRGMVVFATAGPNTRTTQLFINFKDNARLDTMGFSPFGKVIQGMEVVDQLHAEYGEGAPRGRGPDQGRIQAEGNAYLMREFDKLDYIKKATIQE
jgi:peptidyl-prolyl cis-trans isomerase A (cyclophilin A)